MQDVPMQDVRVVVSTAGLTAVHDDSSQAILCTSRFVCLFVVTVDNLTFEFSESRNRVRFHVQVTRKFKVIVEFNSANAIVIVLESLQLYRQYRRKFFHAQSLDRNDLR